MPRPSAALKTSKPANTNVSRRLWLSYPPKLITRPVVWEMSQKFPVVFNIRQASVSDEIGILCLEVSGPALAITSAIRWLGKNGVQVEPVELGILEA